MSFPPAVAESLLVKCHRHCCVCHKPAGTKMVVHHIIPETEGGPQTEDNGIPLCFDCHAEVMAYNTRHPLGRRFTSSELQKHRDQWFAICARPPWGRHDSAAPPADAVLRSVDEAAVDALPLFDWEPRHRLCAAVARAERGVREQFLGSLAQRLGCGDQNTRWGAGMVVEELIPWEPSLVPDALIEQMSSDPSPLVRTSAAVCYYELARVAPSSVALGVLARLATPNEDWYVYTPATAALLRLAHARPAAVEVLAGHLAAKAKTARRFSAEALLRLSQGEAHLIPDHLVRAMRTSRDPFVRQVGKSCADNQTTHPLRERPDYDPF